MYCNVIGTTNCSRAFLQADVHPLLRNILTNTESEGKASKSESAEWAIEGSQIGRLFVENYRPITVAGIQL